MIGFTLCVASTSSLKSVCCTTTDVATLFDSVGVVAPGVPQVQKQYRRSTQAKKGITGSKLSCSDWLRASWKLNHWIANLGFVKANQHLSATNSQCCSPYSSDFLPLMICNIIQHPKHEPKQHERHRDRHQKRIEKATAKVRRSLGWKTYCYKPSTCAQT